LATRAAVMLALAPGTYKLGVGRRRRMLAEAFGVCESTIKNWAKESDVRHLADALYRQLNTRND